MESPRPLAPDAPISLTIWLEYLKESHTMVRLAKRETIVLVYP